MISENSKEKKLSEVDKSVIDKSPHNYIGAIVTESQWKKELHGSCIFLNDNLAITSASSVQDQEYNGKYDIKVYRAPHGQLDKADSYSVQAIRFPKKFTNYPKGRKTQYNYALLKLKPIRIGPQHKEVAWPAIVPSCTHCLYDPNFKHQIALYGYVQQDKNFFSRPALFQKGSISSNRILGIDPEHRYKLKYSIATQVGQSGCPIIIANKLLGFHIGSNHEQQSYKFGRLFTTDLIEEILLWCQQLSANCIFIDKSILCQHLNTWVSSESFKNIFKYHINIAIQTRNIKITEKNLALSKDIKMLKNSLHIVEQQNVTLKSSNKQLLNDLKNVRKICRRLEQQKNKQSPENKAILSSKDSFSSDVQNMLEKEIQTLQKKLGEKQLQNRELINKSNNRQKEINMLEEKFYSQNQEIARLKSIIHALQEQQCSFQERFEALNKEIEKLYTDLRDKMKIIKQSQYTITQFYKECERLRTVLSNIQKFQQKHKILSQYNGQLLNKIGLLSQQIERLNLVLHTKFNYIHLLEQNKRQSLAKIVSLSQQLQMLKQNHNFISQKLNFYQKKQKQSICLLQVNTEKLNIEEYQNRQAIMVKDISPTEEHKSSEMSFMNMYKQIPQNPQFVHQQKHDYMHKDQNQYIRTLQATIKNKTEEVVQIKQLVKNFTSSISEIVKQSISNQDDAKKLIEVNEIFKSRLIKSQIYTSYISSIPEKQQESQQFSGFIIP